MSRLHPPSGRPRGRRPWTVIGTTADGETRRWRNMKECADALGTTPGTLRVYICLDKPYKGFSLDYAPNTQLTLF